MIGTTIFCGLCNMRTQHRSRSDYKYQQAAVVDDSEVVKPAVSATSRSGCVHQPLNTKHYSSYSQSDDCLTVDTEVSRLNSLAESSDQLCLQMNKEDSVPMSLDEMQTDTWMVMGRGVTTTATMNAALCKQNRR